MSKLLKIKDGFILKVVAGEHVVVPVGENVVDFTAMVTLNETGAFIWRVLQDGADEGLLVDAIVNEYDVTREDAACDAVKFVEKLKEADLLE